MSQPTNQGPPSLANAIALLLGRQAAAGGPFALLGLTPDDCTQDLVIVQLQRQLARIAAHPMATSPVADAVRSALHAAAAELLEALDAESPAEPSASVPSLTPSRSFIPMSPAASPTMAHPAPARPTPIPRTVSATITPELAASARDILAEFGGWNARSRQRLAFLAYSAGVRVDELLHAAQSAATAPLPAPVMSEPAIASSPHGPAARAVGVTPDAGLYINEDGTPRSQPFEEEIDPTRRLLKWIILSIVGGLATMLVLAVVAYIMLKPPSAPPPTSPVAQSTAPAAPTTTTPSGELFPAPKVAAVPDKPAPTKPAPLTLPRDFADDLRDLARAATTATSDPDAALRAFDVATKSISSSWPSAPPDQITAMQDTIIEFVYRVAGNPDHAAVAIDLLSRGLRTSTSTAFTGEQVRAAAWSAGILARVARERELPAAFSLRLQSALANSSLANWQGSDASFHSASAAALAVLARSLTPATTAPSATPTLAPDAWPAWVAAVDALRLSQRERDRMVLVAVEDLLTTAPEPTQSKPTFDAISLLITSLTWRDADESRRWLLRWFDRPNVSIADLHTLTSALASKSSAAGFDVSMVLAAGASESERATLRDRLRQAWGLADGPERTKLVSTWRESAEQELNQPASASPGARPLAEFYHAVVLSRLSETAAMIFAGEPGSASIDLVLEASVKSAIDTLGQPSSPPAMLNDEPTWLVRYLSAGSNIAAKKSALAELTTALPLPRAVGEVLVGEVLRGSNSEIRKQAAEIARQRAADPAVVHGWLVQVPSMPAFQEYSDLVAAAALAKLPSVRNPSWRVAARRALVERLLQLLADSGELAGIDGASTLLAQSYAHRLATLSWNARPDAPRDSAGPDAPPSDPILNVPPVETSARLYRQRLEREAQDKTPTARAPLSLAQIASRTEGRSKVAAGRIQFFAAEQVASVELLAYLVAAERPDASSQIAAILDEVSIARRKATHISTQVEAVERAALRLWLLRLEGGKA